MGALIQAGATPVAGTGPGELNQYYGFADAAQTTVTASSLENLCTPYVVPAGEAVYPDVAYELRCAGFGVWGSTQQALTFQMVLGGVFGSVPVVGSVAFNASQDFAWSLVMNLTCSDGVSAWWGDLLGAVVVSTANLDPGTAANNAVPIAAVNSGAHSAATSGALTAVIQAKWGSTTGAPTITTTKTTWKKVA